MNKLQIEYVPIDSINPYENNAKIHTGEQIEQIKKSINEFSMNDPIGIWHNQIVEGHGRWIACKELGIEQVPVIRLDDLTDEQRRAYMLVHNKLTMNTDFDFELLDSELGGIIDIDMSEFGFDFDSDEMTVDRNFMDDDIEEKYSIIIDCDDEIECNDIFDRLIKEGYKCRISTL